MLKLEVIRFKGKDGAQGDLIRKSTKKPEWASLLVMVTLLTINNGVINPRKRVAAVRAKISTLEALGLQAGDDFNAKITSMGGVEHRIKYSETTEPQYEGHKAKVNPTTKEVMKNAAGQPIYLSAEVVPANEQDELISSKAVAAIEKGAGALA